MGIRKIKTIKNMNIRILYRTFFAFYILLTTGCDPEQESWDICKLNEHLGIDLPSSSIVLSASDGGGKRKDIRTLFLDFIFSCSSQDALRNKNYISSGR